MDEYLFSEQLKDCKCFHEETRHLEILNYSDEQSFVNAHPLRSDDDFENFLIRKGAFAPTPVRDGVKFINGIRLVLQQDAQRAMTFSPDVLSFSKESYKSLIKEMKLPFRAIETSSVVGPFFWWTCTGEESDRLLQLVFRKSDVEWRGTSRGWEMVLSYSFNTGITSGYIKGTKSAEVEYVLGQLTACARPAAHPLLLPILMLRHGLSLKNDETQRDARKKVRRLERALSGRYKVDPAESNGQEDDLTLDAINHDIVDSQSRVLWKRPQAWKNVADRIEDATRCFWEHLPDDQKLPRLESLHDTLMSRVDFIKVKLEGLEHYAHVTLERLEVQREVVHGIISQRESRLSAAIAIQQHRLADATTRDSRSMKTLTIMGAVFLPGTFLSSLFSMSFFDFSGEMNGPVDTRLWIYFVIAVPLTAIIVGAWWMLDRRSVHGIKDDEKEAKAWIDELEGQIMTEIREKTGARLRTWSIQPPLIREETSH